MEVVKKYHQKIVAYGLIILGIITIPIILLLHLPIKVFWFSIFFVVVGLTLIPLAKDAK